MTEHLMVQDRQVGVVTPGGWSCSACGWTCHAYDDDIAADAWRLAHLELCPSVNVKCDPKSTSAPLLRYLCTRPAGHPGDCRDRTGGVWVRLEVLLAEDGLALAGGGRARRLGVAS